jgi:hypothetical protein
LECVSVLVDAGDDFITCHMHPTGGSSGAAEEVECGDGLFTGAAVDWLIEWVEGRIRDV